jgi:hypothetical protein
VWHAAGAPYAKEVSYGRDIRPLLAANCYACHGPDQRKRKAGLRLDVREIAVKSAIVPGKAGESPLIERITSSDADEQMPPPGANRQRLSPQAVALIRQWIDQGAKFEMHWSYRPPVRPAVPTVKRSDWPRTPIDRFIAAGHEKEGLLPTADADARTLVRRLRLDLTGLPPSPAEVDAFAADPSPAAYEKMVDRLLALPQYGERMAMDWLDAARYADSCGYHSDNERTVWPYRDYVIGAFNANKPFDRFTIEQLAGDLLPGAGDEQRIASGYNRLLQTTEEGGAQAKEYTAKFAADRARNTATAWLGSTLGCAQCHDHKYDPFTSKDFYSFEAFFADVREAAVGRQEQTALPTPQQAARLAALDAPVAALKKQLDTPTPELEAAQAEWEKSPKPPLPDDVAKALAVERARRNDEQKRAVAAYYRTIAPQLAGPRGKLADLQRQRQEVEQSVLTTLVTVAVPPREVRILARGNWQDDSGPVVGPAIPEFLGSLSVDGRRANRLDMAQWLVARQNPLVARVLVNRLWKLMFGQGLVRTLDDFGTQGAPPTHPELLDWLAVEMIDSGWDIKRMVKLMATSRTYQLSSRPSPELERRDPANRWLARQGRFRLDAETVRDNALAVSGLLSLRLGGPTVKPYQPAGYWDFLNFPRRQWVDDHGESQYRRGLYTFWQRTFLHPSLLAFDAPTREECTVERPRSNTPLQALVLLNDPTYVEAARVFAARIVREGGPAQRQRLEFAFRQALQRPPAAAEADLAQRLYAEHLKQYAADEPAARAVLKVGDAQPPAGVVPAELAAWTSLARVILNLHETITRE